MQQVILDTVQTETTDTTVREVSKTANFHYFNCNSEDKIESLPSVASVNICEGAFQMGGNGFLEGDLILIGSNFGVNVFAKINNKGELLIFGDDADKYSINDGELIYTYCNE